MNHTTDLKPIYTEPENCQDCYKCVRECPVKAIQVEDNKAYIIEERCVYCGHCTQVCPTGAKKIRDGISRTKLLLGKQEKVILSLAPSWVSEFDDMEAPRLIAAIRQLGGSSLPSGNWALQRYPRLPSGRSWCLRASRSTCKAPLPACIFLPPARWSWNMCANIPANTRGPLLPCCPPCSAMRRY